MNPSCLSGAIDLSAIWMTSAFYRIFTGLHGYEIIPGLSTNKQRHHLLLLKTGIHAAPTNLYSQTGSCISKLCAEVWRTGYECFLNPGKQNWKLEIETPKFPAKIDFHFH